MIGIATIENIYDLYEVKKRTKKEKKTIIPNEMFPKTLAAVLVIGHEKKSKQIIKVKINKEI